MRPSFAAAGRGSGRAGPGAAAGKGPKDAAARQAEFRAKKLVEEAEVGQAAGASCALVWHGVAAWAGLNLSSGQQHAQYQSCA